MDDPNDPMRLPLPPSQPSSLHYMTSFSARYPPESNTEAYLSVAGGRPREREPRISGWIPEKNDDKFPPPISGTGNRSTPPEPDTTIHALLSMIRAYVAARAADAPSVVLASDPVGKSQNQKRKEREVARLKDCYPWEETPEKRYPAPNPEYFTEFEKKYPPDAHGEEASPNARVWRVYRDRVTELDDDLLEGWHKTLDVLLIFVGLFSAIATAFIIEAYKELQPDYGEITARGVVALLAQANATFAAPLPIPSFDHVDASARVLWINALWFSSLTLALIDALLTILVKQWLVEYASKQRQPSASGQTWAWRHYAFRQGLDKWGIGVFISTLSVILYGALYLFLFGLLVFLFDLDRRMCVVSMGLTILIGGLHLVSIFLPLWFGDCPTTTPVLTHLRLIGGFSKHVVTQVWVYPMSVTGRLRQQTMRFLPARWSKSATDFVPASGASASTATFSPAAYDGSRIIEGKEPLRDALVISWMLSNLRADNDVLIAIGAFGSLDRARHDNYDWSVENPLRSEFVGPIAERRLRSLLHPNGHRDQSIRYLQQSSVMRALLLLRWKTLDKDLCVSLKSLHAVSVHDISILSAMLHDVLNHEELEDRFFHSDILRRLDRWCSEFPAGPAPLHEVTRQHILRNSDLFIRSGKQDHSFHLDDEPAPGLLRLISQDTISSPESKAALRLLASIVKSETKAIIDEESEINSDIDENSEVVFEFDAKLFIQLDAIIDRLAPAAIRLPTMLWAYFMLTTGMTSIFPSLHRCCRSLYTSSLKQLSHSSLTDLWPLDYVECCLAPFAVEGATKLDWKSSDILAALSVLAQARKGRSNFWSDKLNQSLRGLLKCRRKTNGKINAIQDKVCMVLSGLDPLVHDFVPSELEAHSTRGSFVRDTSLNILSRSHSEDGISTFELLDLGMNYEAQRISMTLTVELAILSHDSLAGLLAPGDDLAELFDAIVGGDRGIKLALADTRNFVIIASHGRVVSRQWWDDVKTQLMTLTKERWSTRNHQFQHDTPQALVDAIEAQRACEHCTIAIIKARKILDAKAAVDSTLAMPQSKDSGLPRPHELRSDGIFADAAPPDEIIAVSSTGWRRRMGNLIECLGIHMRHPPGDAEMQPQGRIETVEE